MEGARNGKISTGGALTEVVLVPVEPETNVKDVDDVVPVEAQVVVV
jgi:hypothetical protein